MAIERTADLARQWERTLRTHGVEIADYTFAGLRRQLDELIARMKYEQLLDELNAAATRAVEEGSAEAQEAYGRCCERLQEQRWILWAEA